jgi:hypothetical protein
MRPAILKLSVRPPGLRMLVAGRRRGLRHPDLVRVGGRLGRRADSFR